MHACGRAANRTPASTHPLSLRVLRFKLWKLPQILRQMVRTRLSRLPRLLRPRWTSATASHSGTVRCVQPACQKCMACHRGHSGKAPLTLQPLFWLRSGARGPEFRFFLSTVDLATALLTTRTSTRAFLTPASSLLWRWISEALVDLSRR